MTDAERRDWVEWHLAYDEPGSRLHRRLLFVQQRLGEALDRCPPGPLRLISLCAGQGRDVLEVLPTHPRRADVAVRLVELDKGNVEMARRRVRSGALAGVDVVRGDASTSTAYTAMVPAHVVMVCGVFGNIPDDDIRHTVAFLPRLCAAGATVIWTRHRSPPDLTPSIRRWFADTGFTEVAFDTDETLFSVGAHRFDGPPLPFRAGVRLFEFRNHR